MRLIGETAGESVKELIENQIAETLDVVDNETQYDASAR